MAQLTKKTLLANSQFVLLDDRNKHFHFLKDEEEVRRWKEDGSIGDGDVVIELTEATVRLAILKNFIEIK